MNRNVALVTGASRGIGRAIAVALAGCGHDLAINYLANAQAAEETRAAVEQAGGRAALVQGDVALSDDRRRIVDQTTAAFGHIDLLVNNAGVAPTVRADILEATEESFDRLIEINLKGPYFLTQLVAQRMCLQIARKLSPCTSPKIINITSLSAYAASTNRGEYCISKAGLSMATQLWATRLAEFGIEVFEIRPGIIQTDMTGPVKARYDKLIFEQDLTPIKRWGTPGDVAQAVVAIASDLFPFSTGQVFDVDGGYHLRRL